METVPTFWFGSLHCPEATAADWLKAHNALLPASWLARTHAYTRTHDKALSAAGKWLLREGLGQLGIGPDRIGALHYPPGRRPVLTDHPAVRFSIAHSGDWVVCAVGLGVELGIDIEQRKDRALGPLRHLFTPNEWAQIEESPDPMALFYRYWASKEAFIKAADRVEIDRFHTFDTSNSTLVLDGQRWYLKSISIHPDYPCWLASDRPLQP